MKKLIVLALASMAVSAANNATAVDTTTGAVGSFTETSGGT